VVDGHFSSNECIARYEAKAQLWWATQVSEKSITSNSNVVDHSKVCGPHLMTLTKDDAIINAYFPIVRHKKALLLYTTNHDIMFSRYAFYQGA
jgi:hypothetical protein